MGGRRVGVDTGGTFTDLVEWVDGALRVRKVPSTPDEPSRAILSGLGELGSAPEELVHGSTVATNALLERRGARTALLVTAGFEDLLRIGRQARRDIYDLDVEAVEPLVSREATLGVQERLAADGSVVEPLADEEIDRLLDAVRELGPDAVAVCLLHAYANPSHERRLRDAIRENGTYVTASSDLLAEFREYERCSTTTINSYVGPVMQRYLSLLEQGSGVERLRVLQSNGGAMSAATAGDNAVHTVLSGPAGGVVGAWGRAEEAGLERIITFDMGGTSSDVSLCDGGPGVTSEGEIAGLPIRVPVMDIHTVGAGGGSIATVDEGGALRVGPRSAGAEPGPACYGHGGAEPTVTDANLVLGRLSAEHFLGGERRLDVAAAGAVVDRLAERLGTDRERAAEGVVRVANATMEGAIRVISVERGHDARDFTLVCFGGAGGMHAAALAASIGMPNVLVPSVPGALSAYGMLRAEPSRFLSRTVLEPLDPARRAETERRFDEMADELSTDPILSRRPDVRLERSVDLRYRGQGFEINLPWNEEPLEAFHRAHEVRYGYADRSRRVELVNVRLRAVAAGVRERAVRMEDEGPDPGAAHIGRQRIVFDGRAHDADVYDRAALRTGNRLDGAALVVEYSSTTLVPPDWRCTVDDRGNLLLGRATA